MYYSTTIIFSNALEKMISFQTITYIMHVVCGFLLASFDMLVLGEFGSCVVLAGFVV